jgi:anti-sigma regulatory factor (Ser/Thr protein kinase)
MTVTASGRRVPLAPHLVQFYDRDDQLVDGVGSYLVAALQRGDAIIAVATPAHLGVIAVHLQALGMDIRAVQASGQFLALDAAATMEAFMVDGWPDPEGFDAIVGAVVRKAHASGRPVSMFGEMVALLWAAGRVNAAVELERLWNDLAAEVPFALLCAYSSQLMSGGDLLAEFDQVCHLHSAIMGGSGADVVGGGVGGASQTFKGTDDAPGAARHFVRDTLEGWGAIDVADDAALIVTELTTNAVLHARSGFRVVVAAAPGSLRISVADDDPATPGSQDFSLSGSSGRGLGLVAALSRQWGTTHVQGGGKVVWAELLRR